MSLQSTTFSETLKIQSSSAKSWYNDDETTEATRYSPENAYDGDYTTTYNVKDNDAVGNFLKLYLSGTHHIGSVKLTHKLDHVRERIIGTEVLVYSTQGGEETKVVTCGDIISGIVNRNFYLYYSD